MRAQFESAYLTFTLFLPKVEPVDVLYFLDS
jgi:hypothetical protein